MAQKTCAHEPCTCEHKQEEMILKNGAYYCSIHCSEQKTSPGASTDCGCGHPDCSPG